MTEHAEALLDTSVILRHLLADHADHSPRATALVNEIELGLRVVRITDTIVFELVYTLTSFYRVARADVRVAVEPFIELPGVTLPGKRLYREVFDLWLANRSLSFADAFHLCFARQHELVGVITFDRKMNRLPDVERIEP